MYTVVRSWVQISANNSTWYRYSKISRNSGNNRSRLLRRIGGPDSSYIQVTTLKFGFYNSCFYYHRGSPRLRSQRFDNRLENESRVGTPICQILVGSTCQAKMLGREITLHAVKKI